LKEDPGLFSNEDRDLKFGDLVSEQLGAGINETWWLRNEEDETTKKADADIPDLPMLPLESGEEA
jgi:hypothetical protein